MPRPARFLTPAQVAEELAVTQSQVYTLMRSGELPAMKIGKRGVSRRALEQEQADTSGRSHWATASIRNQARCPSGGQSLAVCDQRRSAGTLPRKATYRPSPWAPAPLAGGAAGGDRSSGLLRSLAAGPAWPPRRPRRGSPSEPS
ncbi:MAG: helix-turn-helix domain-containing protein [Acidimicrobiia bacterium]